MKSKLVYPLSAGVVITLAILGLLKLSENLLVRDIPANDSTMIASWILHPWNQSISDSYSSMYIASLLFMGVLMAGYTAYVTIQSRRNPESVFS